jgi:hypothetical protein
MDINVLLPTADHIGRVLSQATAPAFILGAVAAFCSLLLNRMTAVIDRIRSLNEIPDEDAARGHLKSDIARLRRFDACCRVVAVASRDDNVIPIGRFGDRAAVMARSRSNRGNLPHRAGDCFASLAMTPSR